MNESGNRPALQSRELIEESHALCRDIEKAVFLIEQLKKGTSSFRLPGKEILALESTSAALALLAEIKLAIVGVVSSSVVWGGMEILHWSRSSSAEERVRLKNLQRVVRDGLAELGRLATDDFHAVSACAGGYGIDVTRGPKDGIVVDPSRLIFRIQLDSMSDRH